MSEHVSINAQSESRQAAAKSTVQICTFQLDGSWYGFDIKFVQEVNRAHDIYPIPHSPDHVRGCMNVRGQIHLIVDLRTLMGGTRSELNSDSRVIVLTPDIVSDFGVLVDRVQDILEVDAGRIQPRDSQSEAGGRMAASRGSLIKADCMLDGSLVMLLDPRKVVDAT